MPKVWATGFRTRGSIPGRVSICFFSPQLPEWLLDSHNSYYVVTGIPPHPDGRGDEANHPCQCSADIQNGWSYTTTLRLCLDGVHRNGKCTFTIPVSQ